MNMTRKYSGPVYQTTNDHLVLQVLSSWPNLLLNTNHCHGSDGKYFGLVKCIGVYLGSSSPIRVGLGILGRIQSWLESFHLFSSKVALLAEVFPEFCMMAPFVPEFSHFCLPWHGEWRGRGWLHKPEMRDLGHYIIVL